MMNSVQLNKLNITLYYMLFFLFRLHETFVPAWIEYSFSVHVMAKLSRFLPFILRIANLMTENIASVESIMNCEALDVEIEEF